VGNTFSPVERMRIDASGNVGINLAGALPNAGLTLNHYLGTAVNSSTVNSALGIGPGGATNPLLGFRWTYSTSAGISGNLYCMQIVNDTANANAFEMYTTGASPIVFGTNTTERVRIDGSGNVLVGATSQVLSGKLTVKGTHATITSDGLSSSAQLSIQAHNGSGYDPKIYFECPGLIGAGVNLNRAAAQLRLWVGSDAAGVSLANGGTSWGSYSDERLKDIIEPITNAAEKVATLRAVVGRYKTDVADKRRVFLIAQDVQAVLPEAVYQNSDEDDTLSLAYTETIPLLVAAIQEQQAIIDSLTTRITALETP